MYKNQRLPNNFSIVFPTSQQPISKHPMYFLTNPQPLLLATTIKNICMCVLPT